MTFALKRAWSDLTLIVLGGVLLSMPVLLLNGFPLTFDDTPGYFEPAFNLLHQAVPPSWVQPAEPTVSIPFSKNIFFLRPFPYMAFLLPFANGLGVWLVPVAQGILVTMTIYRALGVAKLPRRPVVFLGIMLTLALLTSLPIHVGTIMPDVFTGPLILATYATMFGWEERSRLGRFFDIGFLAALTAAHLSHIAILAGFVVILGIWGVLRRGYGLPAVILGLGAPLVLAVGALMAANMATAANPVVSESSPVFLLARLIGDGPARDYLADACPLQGYLLCAATDRLDRSAPGYPMSDYFLWHRDGARHQFGDTPRFLAEARTIARQTIATRPFDVAGHIAANAVRQFGQIALDNSLIAPVKPWTRRFFSRFPNRSCAAFLDARQTRGEFPRDTLNTLQGITLGLSVLALTWVGSVRNRRIGNQLGGLIAVIMFGLLLNATVTGGLSAVHDRYQNRVIWLVPLVAMVVVSCIRCQSESELVRA